MNKKEIQGFQQKIDELGEWYQPIEFVRGELKTNSKYSFDSTVHGINKWNFIIRRNLPDNLASMRILDIGCASGLYSMCCAREGASVVGIELDKEGYSQSKLSREIFSMIDDKDYETQFEILNIDFMDFDWEQYERFDLVLALNVLYWVQTPYRKISTADRKSYNGDSLHALMENIKSHSDLVVIQADENKYAVRRKSNGSLEATDSKRVFELLNMHGFIDIKTDRPLSIRSFWRSLTHKTKTAEVDLARPLYYSRPIITARTHAYTPKCNK